MLYRGHKIKTDLYSEALTIQSLTKETGRGRESGMAKVVKGNEYAIPSIQSFDQVISRGKVTWKSWKGCHLTHMGVGGGKGSSQEERV